MDKLHKTLMIILTIVLIVFIIILILFGKLYFQEFKSTNFKENETFKINFTTTQISYLFYSHLYGGETYYLLENGDVIGREQICLNACGNQCVGLGYSYESSLWILDENEDALVLLKNNVNRVPTDKNPEWCSCVCNKYNKIP